MPLLGSLVVRNEVLARHVGRLLQTHDVEDRGSHVGEASVTHGSRVVVGDVDEGHGVERVGGVGCAVGVDGVVGVAVVGNDDRLIVVGLGSLNDVAHAVVDGVFVPLPLLSIGPSRRVS